MTATATAAPICKGCGIVIPKRANEGWPNYLARSYCSNACRYTVHNPPVCKTCGEPVKRKPGESNQNWTKRSYCSHDCRHARPVDVPEVPWCRVCGGPIRRRDGQQIGHWRRLRTCSEDCRISALSYAGLKVPPPHEDGPRKARRRDPALAWQAPDEVPCHGSADPDAWFDAPGTGGHDAAKRLCRDVCPASADCYAYALAAKVTHGLWGGVWFGGRP